MNRIGELIRNHRIKKGLFLRQLSALTEIDQSILSKIENNERKPSKEQLHKIASALDCDPKFFMKEYLSEKIALEICDEEYASEVLRLAQKKIGVLKK